MKKATLFFMAVLLSGFILAQGDSLSKFKTTVEEIKQNPGKWFERKVELTGTVTQFVPETSETNAHFIIVGKYGETLKVKTDIEEPVQNRKYKIVGTVYSENSEPFIHLRNMSPIGDWAENDSAVEIPVETFWDKYGLIIIIVGAGTLLLIFLIIFLFQYYQNKQRMQEENAILEHKERIIKENQVRQEPQQEKIERPEFTTIKYTPETNKTLKFIPGRLEIISGEDKGKSFKFAGFPTHEGSVVTMGTKEVTGERSYAHILIDRKYRTVSGSQAEIIYDRGKLYVKNISKVNFTQVDGVEIQPDKKAEVKPGSTIRTGELEFKYLLD